MRRRFELQSLVFGGLLVFGGCGGHGGSSAIPPTPVPIASPGGKPGPGVVFSSDQAVVLTKPTDTYQFSATETPGGGPTAIAWSSSDPTVATIDPTGLVHVTGAIGSSTITASAGSATSAYGSVSFAHPLTGTVIIPTSLVLSATQSQVVLKQTSLTSGIALGNVLAAQGDKAGILGRVTSLKSSAGQIVIGTSHAAIDEAFDQFDFEANVPLPDVSSSSQSTSIATQGRVLRPLDAGSEPSVFACSSPTGGSLGNLTANGQSFTAELQKPMVSAYLKPGAFQLKLGGTFAATAAMGSLDLAPTLQTSTECKVTFFSLAFPEIVPLGPYVALQPSFNASAGVDLSLTASGKITVIGPTVTASIPFTVGVQYGSGSWQPLGTANPQTSFAFPAPTATLAPVAYKGEFNVFEANDLGINVIPTVCAGLVTTNACSIVGMDFAEVKLESPRELTVTSFDPKSASYVGPEWKLNSDVKLQLQAALTGDLVTLAGWIFKNNPIAPPAFAAVPLVDWTSPFGFQSPEIDVSASPNPYSAGQAVTVTADVTNTNDPIPIAGKTVNFGSISAGATTVTNVGTATLPASGKLEAITAFTPGAAGSQQFVADVYDGFFGAINLPYRGTTPATSASPTPAPTGKATPAPSGTPVPVPIFQPTPASTLAFTKYQSNAGPLDITAGPDGNLWFTSLVGICKITTAGVITEMANVLWADGIIAGPDGNLWFTQGVYIGKITPAGLVTQYTLPQAANGLGSSPTGITAGPDGNLWFTDIASFQIGKITTAGVITEYPLPQSSNIVSGAPSYITAGPDGNLWFSGFDNIGTVVNGYIGKITTAGVITKYPLPTNDVPADITKGSDGNIWYVVPAIGSGHGVIGKITPGGVITEYPPPGVSEGGLTNGPDGNLWFGELGEIGKITTDGVITEYPVTAIPERITAGPDGNLWFGDLANPTAIWKMTLGVKSSSSFRTAGVQPPKVVKSSGIRSR